VTGASLGGGFITRMFDWAMTRGAGQTHPAPREGVALRD
jgi:hypothetical protein